ncbi:MAG: hypothetical protein JEZ11_27140 [Desulfobacterales bacterium]|nr:hypothetical protein [Desulfobacterales bacterium]
MKKWKCTVCGYIHTGIEPPEKCPVCGADRSKFVEIIEEKASAQEEKVAAIEDQDGAQERKWRCTVCGYIHTGVEPPEKCPVCGADRSKFVEITEAPEASESTDPISGPTAKPTRKQVFYDRIAEQLVRSHAHPISVHIPNGVAPVAVLFLFMAVVFDSPALELAAFYNMIVVLVAMPVVLFTGYNDWKKRFGGNITSLFLGKMACGAVVTLMALVAVIWRTVNPDIALGSSGNLGYLAAHAVLLGAGAIAGYLGGKLVFNQS